MSTLTAWQNFYVVVGSSAGALIGLQFVVLSLIMNRPAAQTDSAAGHAFTTPTIVYFATVLGLAAVLCAPWSAILIPAWLWGIAGLAGIIYNIAVVRRMRVQAVYKPEFEDWLFHALLPMSAYVTLMASAGAASVNSQGSLFAVGGASLLLLFIGIHNAWDAVTYHVFVLKTGRPKE